MSESAKDVSTPSPPQRRVRFSALMFGMIAAPLMWMGHLWLSYGISSHVCYPGDIPIATSRGNGIQSTLMVVDFVAIAMAVIAGVVSYRCWQRTHEKPTVGPEQAIHIGEGRSRFLALWGMMLSGGFLAAILFATIASVMVPLCGR